MRKQQEYNYSSKNQNGNNSEDADKCLDIAQKALIEGDLKRAEKFARKAERMCLTRRGKNLLDQILGKSGAASGASTSGASIRQVPISTSPSQESGRKPTQEHLKEINRVREARDVYDVLGIHRNYSPEEVTTAFRRLTLLLHPDKNKADGAKEAYMTVTEAVRRLRAPKPTVRSG